jgi:hypothetical protein
MEDLAALLLFWIGANSDYDTRNLPLPEIVEMSPRELTDEFYGGSGLRGAQRPSVDPRIMALYSTDEGLHGRIYIIAAHLTDGLQPGEDPLENPVFQERLLHELVHHVQHRTGAADAYLCNAAGEMEAYAMGGAYLDAIHADDPLPNRNFWARIYSRC